MKTTGEFFQWGSFSGRKLAHVQMLRWVAASEQRCRLVCGCALRLIRSRRNLRKRSSAGWSWSRQFFQSPLGRSARGLWKQAWKNKHVMVHYYSSFQKMKWTVCLDSSSEHCCFQLAELFSVNITLKSYTYCKKILKKGENSRSIIYKTLQWH